MNFNTGTNIVIFNMGDSGGSRGSLIVNTAHGGSQSIAANTEWQFASPGHFAFGPGAGGHIQLGIATYDEAHPYWGYWQYADDPRSATRGFSGAQTFTVQMYASAGTATNSFHPGMFGQQDTVNGGYYLDTFADLGVTGGGGVKDAWNPTTIAPGLRLHFGNYRSTTLPGSVIVDQSLTTATTTQALSF